MYAPIFDAALLSSVLVGLLDDGAGGIKLYPFKLAPEGVTLPYVTWQNINGSPENFLADDPDVDKFTIQVNVWGETSEELFAVVKALRNAIQRDCYIVRWGNTDIDAQTKALGYDFDADWLTYR